MGYVSIRTGRYRAEIGYPRPHARLWCLNIPERKFENNPRFATWFATSPTFPPIGCVRQSGYCRERAATFISLSATIRNILRRALSARVPPPPNPALNRGVRWAAVPHLDSVKLPYAVQPIPSPLVRLALQGAVPYRNNGHAGGPRQIDTTALHLETRSRGPVHSQEDRLASLQRFHQLP